MKFGVPWSVKGIRPEARETAREAARRSGMSLGDWLNSVIFNQAAEQGIDPDALDDDDERHGVDLSTVHERLDDISRRIDKVAQVAQVARPGPEAYAPQHSRNDQDQLAELIKRLDHRLDQFANATRPPPMPIAPPPPMAPPPAPSAAMPVQLPPALNLAIAEIVARQHALNKQAAAPKPPAAPPIMPPNAAPAPPPAPRRAPPVQMPPAVAPRVSTPLPTQDLSGLEDQLRAITTQIETLRKPGVEEAINALREELGAIAHTLTEAMPRRAIEAIERQIAELNHRIAEGRQAGVDANALSGIEHGLAEVRDALHGLMPAENLVGFNDAIASLTYKIDMIVAQRDPATMQQLERAITTLREISAHVASNQTVDQLAAEVQRLGQNVEQIAMASGGGDALAHLEHRIGALSDALAERTQNGASVPPRLEALVSSLSDKIEQIQNSRGDSVAIGHLEDRIATLVQKLDASDSRFAHLEAIERGLADLLVHIEEIKASKVGDETAPAVDSLKDEIVRTQNALDAVHGTLGVVVDRLAMIEQGIGETRPQPPPTDAEPLDLKEPVGKLAVRLIDAAAAPPVAPLSATETPPPLAAPAMTEAPPAPKHMPAARQLSIDPDLPGDQPLEPGSGRPSLRANPAARIAASEAALGGARPAAATVPSNKSNFIAAARRAAQAAVQESPPRRPPRSAADFMDADAVDAAKPRKSLIKRVKSLFIAASIIAVVIGAVQIASNFIDFGSLSGKLAQSRDAGANKVANAAPDDKTADAESNDTSDAPETMAADSQPAANQPDTAPLASAAGNTAAAAPAAPQQSAANIAAPLLSTAPTSQLPGFVTGSISPPADNPALPKTPLMLPPAHNGGHLPAAIGSIRLRSAATAGDAAAAYEIGMRYAEGHGVPADMTEAARWFERAASKGLAPAQFRYGSLLEKGQGVTKNLAEARRLYLAAANAGNAKAMHNLAVLYAEGVDGKPDYGAAAQWFQKAADHGVPDSQFNLGVLYARGLGVSASFAESYKWFALAANKGDKEALKRRDEVASRLDSHALAAAQLAAKTFVAQTQPDAATNVAQPPGGWDAAASAAPPARAKPRVGEPLVLGNR